MRRRVAVTRHEGADGPLSSALWRRGLEPVPCSVISHAPPLERSALRRAARGLEQYHWLVVASARGLANLLAARHGPHPLSVATASAVLDALALDPGIHDRLEQVTVRLAGTLCEAARAAGLDGSAAPLRLQHIGTLWTPFFSSAGPMRCWDDAARADIGVYARFFRAMLARGILLPPSSYECAFVSAAHGDEEIALTVAAAREAFREVAV